MGLIAPPMYIAPPATEPLRFGLYSAANMPDPVDRWEMGVEWEPIAGARAELRPHECVDAYTPDVAFRDGESTLEGVPFLVVGTYSCLSASRPLAEAEQRARLHLDAGEERAVEYAITLGTMGNLPSLQGATDLTPVPGTAVSVEYGTGLIEGALAEDYGSVGTIHAPRITGPWLAEFVARQGSHLETLVGTIVAAGGGYDIANVGPTGVAPAAGSAWLYGTGRPTVRRSEVFVQPDDTAYLDRSSNDVTIMAQRAVLVTWEGPTVAVLVDVTGA